MQNHHPKTEAFLKAETAAMEAETARIKVEIARLEADRARMPKYDLKRQWGKLWAPDTLPKDDIK